MVVMDGTRSKETLLRDMVYQGTVLGPPLWNIFFADARHVVPGLGFAETVFADDQLTSAVKEGCFEEKSNALQDTVNESTAQTFCVCTARNCTAPNQPTLRSEKSKG